MRIRCIINRFNKGCIGNNLHDTSQSSSSVLTDTVALPFIFITFFFIRILLFSIALIPPAGGLPVIKYNTPEQNVSFFALFSALFFFLAEESLFLLREPGFSGTHRDGLAGSGSAAKGCAISCQSVRIIFSAWQYFLVSPTEESFQPNRRIFSAQQKNLVSPTG